MHTTASILASYFFGRLIPCSSYQHSRGGRTRYGEGGLRIVEDPALTSARGGDTLD